MKYKHLVIFLEVVVLVSVSIWVLLFAIGMSCPSCAGTNLAYISEIIIMIGISVYSVCNYLIYNNIALTNKVILRVLLVLFGIFFLLGTISDQYWVFEYFTKNVISDSYRFIFYPCYSWLLILFLIVLLFSDLKLRSLTIGMVIIPKLIIGLIYSIIGGGELYLLLLIVLALIDIVFVILYSRKYNAFQT
ncbi:hypothetical protein [Leptospira wolffii]|uniref:Permease n=2 Tax=Leptospira wolffii TaxID=409998 RepID=A0ABV5BNL9_9LEPT